MANVSGSVTILPKGQSVTYTIVAASGRTPTCYNDATGTATVSNTGTITSSLKLYVDKPDRYSVSLTIGGYECADGLGTAAQVTLDYGNSFTFQPSLPYFDIPGLVTGSGALLAKANNLSDLTDASSARTNLGLGTAATTASSAYDAAGAASTAQGASLQKTSNLSDLANAGTARTNLGLGTAATTAATAYAAATHAAQHAFGTGTDPLSPVEATTTANTGSAYTILDVTTSTIKNLTLTANCTFTFPTAGAGKSFLLVLTQDGTGSRTASWPGTVKWGTAGAPTLTTTASKSDILSFVCVDGTNWLGVLSAKGF